MNPLDKVIGEVNKKYKNEIITKGTERIYVEKIPFSSPRINYITYGGIPLGKLTEMFGGEGGGKTTTAIDVTSQAQKKAKFEWVQKTTKLEKRIEELEEKNNKSDQKLITKLTSEYTELMNLGPKKVVYVDAENTLDEEWARLNGVNTDELILVRPEQQTAEQVLQMIIDIIDSGQVIMLVLDSIPMLVSQNLYDQDLEKKSYGGIAGAVTEFCRKVTPKLSKYKTALVMINQVREDLQNPFNQYNTPGGRALKHAYSLRLFFRKGKFIDLNNNELNNRAEEPEGNLVDVNVVKTKVCKPDRRVGFYTLKYGTGIDVLADTVEMAIRYGFIIPAGAWFSFINPETGELLESNEGPLKFQGKPKVLNYLREDQDLFEELYDAVDKKLKE